MVINPVNVDSKCILFILDFGREPMVSPPDPYNEVTFDVLHARIRVKPTFCCHNFSRRNKCYAGI